MKYILLFLGKIINNLFKYSQQDYRYFESWKYIYRIGLQGIGRIQGNPIEKSGEVDVIKKIMKGPGENRTFLDVGSNQGLYSTQVMANVNGSKKIALHIFEPSQVHITALNDQFNVSRFPGHRFFINQLALSDNNAVEYLYTDRRGSDLGSLWNLKIPIRPFDDAKKEKVTTMTLDCYLEKNQIACVDLLKIDVEGAEFKVLTGAAQSIAAGKIRNIQFEFGAGNITARIFFYDFWNLLSSKYRFYQVLAGGLVAINSYSIDLEIFRTTNYFLELI